MADYFGDFLDKKQKRRREEDSNDYFGSFLPVPESKKSPGFFRSAADIGVKTVAGVPQALAGITGLGTMVPGVRELADPATAGLTQASRAIEESLLSNYQLRKQREMAQRMQEEEGFLDQAGAMAKYLYENPRQIATTAAASLPSMLAGGLIGRGLQLTTRGTGMAMSPATAAALGEGTVIAGGVAGDIAAQSPELSDRLYGIPAGIGGATVSRLSGRLMGRSDIDTMLSARLARQDLVDAAIPEGAIASRLAQGSATDILAPAGTTTGRISRGIIGEGLLEEAPQSAMERMATNVGTGRPMMENVGGDVVLGAASGGLMGAGAGVRRPGGTYTPEESREALRIMADRESPLEQKAIAANFVRGIEIGRLGEKEATARFNDYISGLIAEQERVDPTPKDLLSGLQQVETRRGLITEQPVEETSLGRAMPRLVPTGIPGVLLNQATGNYEIETQPEPLQRVTTQRPVQNIPGVTVDESGVYRLTEPTTPSALVAPSGGTPATVSPSALAAPGVFSTAPAAPKAAVPKKATKPKVAAAPTPTISLGEELDLDTEEDQKTLQSIIGQIKNTKVESKPLEASVQGSKFAVPGRPSLAQRAYQGIRDALLRPPKKAGETPKVSKLYGKNEQTVVDALYGFLAAYNAYASGQAISTSEATRLAKKVPVGSTEAQMAELSVAEAGRRVAKSAASAESVRQALAKVGEVLQGNAKDVEVIVRLIKDTVQKQLVKAGKDWKKTIPAQIEAAEKAKDTKTANELKKVLQKLKRYEQVDIRLSSAWNAAKQENFLNELADISGVSSEPLRVSEEAKEADEKGLTPLEAATKNGYGNMTGTAKKEKGIIGLLNYLRFHGTPYSKTLAFAVRNALEVQDNLPKVRFITEGKSRYDPNTDTIYINKESSPEVALHEAMHSALQWFVYSNPNSEYVKQLEKSLDTVLNFKGQLNPKAEEVRAVLRKLVGEKRNLDAVLELVSYTATMNEFRRALQAMPSQGVPKTFYEAAQNIWRMTIALMGRFLGVKPNVASDVLVTSMKLLERSTVKATKPAKLTGKPLEVISPITSAFRRWFGDSKVVDENGQPLVVYHGTNRSFTAFAKEVLGKATGAPSAKLGFFFAGDPSTSAKYAKNAVRSSRLDSTVIDTYKDMLEKKKAELSEAGFQKAVKSQLRVLNNLYEEEKAQASDAGYNRYLKSRGESILEPVPKDAYIKERERSAKYYEGRITELENNPESYREEHNKVVNSEISALQNILDKEIEAQGEEQKFGEPAGPNIVPVYLSIKNPMIIDQKGEQYRIMSYYDTVKKAQSLGHDGVIIKNTYDGKLPPGWVTRLVSKWRNEPVPSDTIYIAFEPNQIKSIFNQAPTEAPGILEAAVVSNTTESPMPNQVSNVDFRAFANSQESWRMPTQIAGELLGFGKNGATTNYIKERGAALARKIRKDYPSVETFLLNFNSKFSNGVLANKLIDTFKFDQNTGYMQAEKIAEYLDANPEVAKPFLAYMDGDKNALNKIDDNGRLRGQADYLLKMHEQYIESLPETSPEREYFKGKKFSEYIIVPRKVSQVAGNTFGVKALGSMLGIKPIDERNIDFFKPWLNEVNGVLEPDNLYQVMERIDGELVHAGFMAKSKFEKDGTPPGFTVKTDLIWRMSELKNGAYRFTARMTAAQAVERRDISKVTTALLNTTAALAHTYASRNFLNGMATIGYEDGKPNAESVAFNSIKEINSVFGGRKITEDDVVEASDDVIKSPRIRTLLQRTGSWVKLPDSPTYGPLAGKYMPGPVWNSMVDMHDRSPLINSRIFNETMGWFKEAKTIFNPGTHVTNFLTNVTLLYLHNIPISTAVRAARLFALYEISPKRLTKDELRTMQSFMASGAMLGEYTSAEVKKTIYDALEKAIKPDSDSSVLTKLNAFSQYEKIKAGLQKLRNKSKEVYAAEDNIFRLAAFLNTAGNIQFRDKSSALSDEQMKEAGLAARKMFLDYDIDARAVRAARQSVLPFVSWSYAIMPVLGRIAVEKPWTIANVMLAYMLVQAAMGGGDEEDEELRKAGPKYIRERAFGVGPYMFMRLPFMGDDENPAYMNLGKYVPFFTIFQPPPGQGMLAGQSWIPGFLTPSGPIVSLVSAMTGYDPFTGKPLHQPTDDEWDKLTNFGKAVYDTVAPPALNSKFIKDLNDLSEGKTTITGREPDTLFLARKLGGLSLYEFNIDESLIKQQKAVKVIEKDFKAAMRKAKQDEYRKGYPDYEALDEKLEVLRERMEKRIAEVRGGEEEE